MKFILLALLAVACQDYNSNSNDVEKYSKIELTQASGKFEPAYYIIQQRCTNCHSSSIHNPWASYTDEQDWIKQGLVVAGDPDNSQFIVRIINHGSGGDMPQGMGPLPDDEYQKLVDWVNAIP